MTTATLSDVSDTAETDRNTFNYLKRGGLLHSTVRETTPGVPTALSKKNAIEIASISALAGAGLKVADASDRANSSEWLHRVKSYDGGPLFYGLNSRTGFGFFFILPICR